MLVVSFALVTLSAENIPALYGGCVTVSVLVHYFTLVAVMWMGAEALLMFLKLVIVFIQITTKFVVFVSIFCWSKFNSTLFVIDYQLCTFLSAVPIFLVLIPLSVDLANGHDIVGDIIMQRSTTKDDISL